jgi:ADP-ribosylglycohydrolase
MDPAALGSKRGQSFAAAGRVRGMSVELRERIRGCLLSGAVGDALGAAVEFDSRVEIRRRFGPDGICEYAPAYGRLGAITDDTQMTLFTAEGLILALRGGVQGQRSTVVRTVHRAYLRWLRTQGERSSHPTFSRTSEGWLATLTALQSRRAPGNTCLTALRARRMGSFEHPLNTSKGCGGVMRIAPVGLAWTLGDPFRLGCEVAALTHGHPTGYLAAGALALMIRDLLLGGSLETAVEEALGELARRPGHEECTRAIGAAVDHARYGAPTAECIESLGKGWVAEEALAIALYCALVASDPVEGLRLAVNHGGDSDSTGAITGHLLGIVQGPAAIPERWLEALELRDEIERVADELYEVAVSSSAAALAPAGHGDASTPDGSGGS